MRLDGMAGCACRYFVLNYNEAHSCAQTRTQGDKQKELTHTSCTFKHSFNLEGTYHSSCRFLFFFCTAACIVAIKYKMKQHLVGRVQLFKVLVKLYQKNVLRHSIYSIRGTASLEGSFSHKRIFALLVEILQG